MERNQDCSEEQVKLFRERFLSRLNFADRLFDGKPFNISTHDKDSTRPVAGVYDGVMQALDKLWVNHHSLEQNKALIQYEYRDLIIKKGRTGALTGSANTSADIKDRIKVFYDLLAQYAGNHV